MVSSESGIETASLAGEMSLTLLSPSRAKLDALKPKWECGSRMPGLIQK